MGVATMGTAVKDVGGQQVVPDGRVPRVGRVHFFLLPIVVQFFPSGENHIVTSPSVRTRTHIPWCSTHRGAVQYHIKQDAELRKS